MSPRTWSTWIGRIVLALPVLFLAVDAVVKLLRIGPVKDSFKELGYPQNLALGIGLLEAICLLVLLIPRTSILGAVLLTGYLGGAVATHVRIGNPLASHVLFPVYIGILIWIGMALIDSRILRLVAGRA
jgi:hypothetical protein